MAMGGGTFTTQNKTLPGAYINLVSAANASGLLTDNGVVAVGMSLDWGDEAAIFQVDAETVVANSMKLFGYLYTDAAMKDIREMFLNAKTAFIYRLNGGGVKATVTIGALIVTAKYAGTRGNALKMVISANVLDGAKFDVKTYMGTELVDSQVSVANIAGLVANDYVTFNAAGVLTNTAGTNLATGTNSVVSGTQHTAFMGLAESYAFNTMIVASADAPTLALYLAYVKRRRDDNGVKFQIVAYQLAGDHEGVISVENTVTDAGANTYSLVFWVGGIAAGVPINQANTNVKYNGEYTVNAVYTQAVLETNIKAGKFMFHRVGADIRVLKDINTLVTLTEAKGADFQSNQTIRVLDKIATDIAALFNTKYLGSIPNDASGRISLWNDIVAHHKTLQNLRAIENFSPNDVVVTAGVGKTAIVVSDVITTTNSMEQLYMTIVVE